MAEYHVGCGAFAIYAGTLNSKNKSLWQNKTECTDEALCAVRDYMVSKLLGGIECKKAVSSGYEWTLKDGRTVELRVTIKDKFYEVKSMGLWKSEEDKLNRSGRKWKESLNYMPYRCAELFCEDCGVSLGIYDIVCTNLESKRYCGKCVNKYIKDTPIILSCGRIIEDYGDSLDLEYTDNHYKSITVNKTCYFNKKGRYIKVKGERFYV